MSSEKIIKSAKNFFNLKLNAKGISDLDEKFLPNNLNEAYLIQDQLKIQYLTLKDNICIGKKVGCTNKEAQEQVGIHEPFYGNLFSKFSNTNKSKLNSINFSNPYIEPEIAFLIKNDLDISKAPFTIKDSTNLFEAIICSIEIVDFRFLKPINKIGIENLIATNGASDYWIRGFKKFCLNEVNLLDNPVSIFVNNELKDKGNTNKVLGNPINSAIWLINKICKNGEIMLKGQYITTGSCTKAIKLQANSKIKAEFNNLETIEFEYN